MKEKTKQLKELMWNHQEQYDRVGVLKDAFKGETAYICTSGPTFNQFSSEKLNEMLKVCKFVNNKNNGKKIVRNIKFY